MLHWPRSCAAGALFGICQGGELFIGPDLAEGERVGVDVFFGLIKIVGLGIVWLENKNSMGQSRATRLYVLGSYLYKLIGFLKFTGAQRRIWPSSLKPYFISLMDLL